MIGGLACLVPVVGAALALIPPFLVGLLTSVPLGLFMVLYSSIVLVAILIWVKPRLLNREWNHAILTVIFLIGFAEAFGMIGILIAPPISMVIQILWSRLVTHPVAVGASDQISDLKERLAHLWETVDAMDGLQWPLVTSGMERLSILMDEAEPFLENS